MNGYYGVSLKGGKKSVVISLPVAEAVAIGIYCKRGNYAECAAAERSALGVCSWLAYSVCADLKLVGRGNEAKVKRAVLRYGNREGYFLSVATRNIGERRNIGLASGGEL